MNYDFEYDEIMVMAGMVGWEMTKTKMTWERTKDPKDKGAWEWYSALHRNIEIQILKNYGSVQKVIEMHKEADVRMHRFDK